jgi:hypothetical protein
VGESAEDCDGLESCLKGCTGVEDATCQSACYTQWPGCTCLPDPDILIVQCATSCFSSCLDPISKSCWDCVIDCGFDTQCQ